MPDKVVRSFLRDAEELEQGRGRVNSYAHWPLLVERITVGPKM